MKIGNARNFDENRQLSEILMTIGKVGDFDEIRQLSEMSMRIGTLAFIAYRLSPNKRLSFLVRLD